MNYAKIEKVSTISGVILLSFLGIFGILGCIEMVADVEISRSNRGTDIWTIIPLITGILIFCCFLVSAMLNISRIAESTERLATRYNEKYHDSEE